MASYGGYSQESISQQAQHIWTMLDEMAATNPESYKKFIDKHIKEGKEYMAPPKPHMCVKTVMYVSMGTKKSPFYINFCGWNKVPSPKTPDDAVPVIGTPIHEINDQSEGKIGFISVAFNPKILEEYGRNCKNKIDQETLINLAIDYIHDQQKIKLSRQFKLLGEETLYKGQINVIENSFTKKDKSSTEMENQISELEKTFGPLTGNEKESLLSKLSNISVNDDQVNTTPSQARGTSDRVIFPLQNEHENPKKGLIEEISTETSETVLKKPDYKLLTDRGDNGQIQQITIKIDLPSVKSVTECELDLCQYDLYDNSVYFCTNLLEDLQLLVEDKYSLQLKLPCKIDDTTAGAKFNKKSSCLTVTASALK
ncbi:hypothetical protein KUTeg_005870 [Tegillarca granosa]|uniref:PIH1 domain-containing protein 2 n=1 Tax=Tegillarca granosa TaxID=220873 RepID=A0ABQ9FH01_TEGGR|nr:hypothetical protein KUTeg_005870 [Tegillarca granosa]